MKKFLNFKSALIAVTLIVVLLFVFEFGLRRDPGCTLTGFDAMGQLSTSFWIGAVLGLVVLIALIVWLLKKYNDADDYNISSPMVFGVLAFVMIMWIKAADVKANCGTTGTKGNPANQNGMQDNRQSVEEQERYNDSILKKK